MGRTSQTKHVTGQFTTTPMVQQTATSTTHPRYMSVNRQKPSPPPPLAPEDRDWHSISFGPENVLKGLQFQTNSQAEQIHIRVTATTETIRDKTPTLDTVSSHNIVVNGGMRVGEAVDDNGTTTPKHNTNPIKLIITTSGALGHHNQAHNYHDVTANPNTAYGGVYTAIHEEEDSVDAYDDLGNNLDLASLLAHHEANLDLDDRNYPNDNTALKSATPEVSAVNEEAGVEDEEPVVVEIMRATMGGEGGVTGGGVETLFYDDYVERQKEAATVKVSVVGFRPDNGHLCRASWLLINMNEECFISSA